MTPNRYSTMFKKTLKLIENAYDYLDLGNCDLTDEDLAEDSLMDQGLRKCVNLKVLILSNFWFDYEDNAWKNSRNKGNKNNLTILPAAISTLKSLQQLVCTGYGIRNINLLNGLDQLEYLDMGNNKIQSLNSLQSLYRLKKVFLWQNKIQSLKEITGLTHINHLDFSRNQLEVITGIEKMTNLIRIDFSRNSLRSLVGLETLNLLEVVNLSRNQIQNIQPLTNCNSITNLDLHGNEIHSLAGIEKISGLKRLNLNDNKISDIDELLPLLNTINDKLNIVFDTSGKVGFGYVSISGNLLTLPPIEVLKLGNNGILNYFASLSKQGTDFLYEAKMLIVGQPRAGKTSLRHKLLDAQADLPDEEKTTRGIDIQRLEFNVRTDAGKTLKFYYNVWDFGGQHIYQTTHQFFLSRRSLYLLVLDTGKDSIGNDDSTLNYWLQVVELLGGSSPLIIVKNEKNERRLNIDIAQKKARFEFIVRDYTIDLNALVPKSKNFNQKRNHDFSLLKNDIENELKRLPLVGFAMPKNWVQIRNELQKLSEVRAYITKQEYLQLCIKLEITEEERQLELSRIFHDLGVFLHFQDYPNLDNFIILQNTWATDAVFAIFDNLKVQEAQGRFSDEELSSIWEHKNYVKAVHKNLLALMMQFELCYQVDKSKPSVYIIPEMLDDLPPEEFEWPTGRDLPLQYRYDFMPKGVVTRLIVRLHKYLSKINGRQIVWKTGMVIDGDMLDCPKTIAEITEAWDSKQLNIRVRGSFAKELMSKITFQIDQLNDEIFDQPQTTEQSQKSKWYKKIPCNCVTCKNKVDKNFYDYRELLKRSAFGKRTIECKEEPFSEVSISELIDGVFSKDSDKPAKDTKEQNSYDKQTIRIFLASSSELKKERKEFESFINQENKVLSPKGIFLDLQIWEDFLDSVSQTRLQDEYNKVIESCDIFVMLYFTKVGMYTLEEFSRAFNKFKSSNRPLIYTYFKKGKISSARINKEINSLLDFQNKLRELGHFQTEFTSHESLHLHFKRQLEKLLTSKLI